MDAIEVTYGRDKCVAPGRQLIHVSRLSFEQTISTLEAGIEKEGLWIVARLDPKMLLAKGGFQIQPARQLFYFHPRLMARLLAANPAAIVEAPLKLVVMESPDGMVTVRHPDISAAFAAYDSLTGLTDELIALTARIVAPVVA